MKPTRLIRVIYLLGDDVGGCPKLLSTVSGFAGIQE